MISVCMATYNGANVLPRQLRSILKQLSDADEIIIVDDASADQSVAVCRQILAEFTVPFQLIDNTTNLGPMRSFEKALTLSTGDYIFFSDQDDEWLPNKVATCMTIFQEQQADLIVHDACLVDGQFNILHESWNTYKGNKPKISVARNLWKNGLAGAMMCISKRLKTEILPFPDYIQMHDQWIFLRAKKKKLRIVLTPEILMNYVRHGGNATGYNVRSKKEMFIGRLNMVLEFDYE